MALSLGQPPFDDAAHVLRAGTLGRSQRSQPSSQALTSRLSRRRLLQGRPSHDLSKIVNTLRYCIVAAQSSQVLNLVRRGPQHGMSHSLAHVGKAYDLALAVD